jgi:hypothetical protein
MSVETNDSTWTETMAEQTGLNDENGELPAWAELLAESETQLRDLIRAHPVGFVVGAAAIGFAVARLMRDE